MLGQKKTVLFDIDSILAKINIEERGKVAELGCGNFGFFVFPLARLVGKYGKVYAVDIMRDCLKEIEAGAKTSGLRQIETVWSNLEIFKATKIESSSIDAATLINVLNQSKKYGEILKEAARMIKTKGNLLIIEWKSSDIALGPEADKRIKTEDLKERAAQIGLNIVEEFEAGPYHYGLILRKF